MKTTPLNNNWYFGKGWNEDPTRADCSAYRAVRIPHTVKELPLDSFDPELYQGHFTYVHFLFVPEEWRGKRIFIRFDGAAHIAKVFCGGQFIGEHRCGYTSFRIELTGFLRFGTENTITVLLDSTENPEIPPFGGVIDYLTYGGLYREATLEIGEHDLIDDIFIRGDADGLLKISCSSGGGTLRVTIQNRSGRTISSFEASPNGTTEKKIEGITPWSPEHPELYTALAELFSDGVLTDSKRIRFGFRTAEFRADGFFLNGEKTKLRGLNRHQCWPYIGYAAPARAQRTDADILKNELGCNAVRTSHYPQSQHFIDHCDEIGLLVFTEIPGWQHIGDKAWQKQAAENTHEMVLQYRNHPSVILWGVRINESPDADALYIETNRIAHELDDSRATGGVRNFAGSHLFEDVYTYNDFVHSGGNRGCCRKEEITPDISRAYMVTEYNGHMFPTKPCDDELHRLQHARRHARVLNDVCAKEDIAGSFGWCMFDYNTHREFGSGNNVCYHGVMDCFRNPKIAAAVYASQSDDAPVLEISSNLDIGEQPACYLSDVLAFSNAERIDLYKNGAFVRSFMPSGEYPDLPHPPFLINDRIGCLLETQEGYGPEDAEKIKNVLEAIGRYGKNALPADVLAVYTQLGIPDAELGRLSSRYLAYWGGTVDSWRFDAVRDGEVICSRVYGPPRSIRLRARADTDTLIEGDTWDMASVRIAAVDEHGNVLPYCSRALRFEVSGDIELVGPDVVPLSGGCAGCYIRSAGRPGSGTLTITAPDMQPVTMNFKVIAGIDCPA